MSVNCEGVKDGQWKSNNEVGTPLLSLITRVEASGITTTAFHFHVVAFFEQQI
jgi:hypothetical protein